MPTPTKRVGAYLRVSSEQQLDNHSIDAQRRLALRYCAERDWEIVQFYEELGVSARHDRRPAFQQMIADASAGLIDVVLVYKFDRFARNVEDALKYIKILLAHNVQFVSLTENFDATTPMGKMQMQMMAVFAEFYSNNLSSEYRKGKRERAEKGLWNGDIPFGYTKNEQTGRLEPHPIDAAGVQFAFAEYLTGHYTDADIATKLNAAGYSTVCKTGRRRFTKDSACALLKNRFYLGVVVYKKQWFPGQHPALIDEPTFEQALALRRKKNSNPNRAHRTSRTYPLAGMLYCGECGTRYRGQNHPTSGRVYWQPARSYDRPCTQAATITSHIEDDLATVLGQIQLPADWREHVLAEVTKTTQQHKRTDAQRAKITAQLKRAEELYYDGSWTEKQYKDAKQQAQTQLAELDPAPALDLEKAATILSNLTMAYQHADLEQRKRLFQIVVERVYLRDGQIYVLQPKPDFYPLINHSSGPDEIRIPTHSAYKKVASIDLLHYSAGLTTSPLRI